MSAFIRYQVLQPLVWTCSVFSAKYMHLLFQDAKSSWFKPSPEKQRVGVFMHACVPGMCIHVYACGHILACVLYWWKRKFYWKLTHHSPITLPLPMLVFSDRLMVRSNDSLLVLLCRTIEPWVLFNDCEEWTMRCSLSLSDFKAHISFWNEKNKKC